MQPFKLDAKFLEIITMIVREQNEQLLAIIANNEKINKRSLAKYIPLKFEIKRSINAFVGKDG
jgi:hypothetical protein